MHGVRAAWVTWKTRSTLPTLALGMGALWLLKYFTGEWRLCRAGSGSLGCHQYGQRQFDELLVVVDGVQGATHVVGDIG